MPAQPVVDFPRHGSRIPAHIEARRQVSLGLETEVAELHQLNLGKRLGEMFFFIGLGLMGGALNLSGTSNWALPVMGTLATVLALNAFILLMDDGMHGTLFANSFWNRWASVALGLTYGMSFTAYQVVHLRHHHFLGSANDPDDYHNYAADRRMLWAMHYLRLIVGPYLYLFMIPSLAFRYATAIERRQIIQEYIGLGLVYGLLFSTIALRSLWLLWLMPLMITGHLTAIRGLAQHGLTDSHDPFLASRSMRISPLMAFLMVNENYHLEHHFFPEIPSYQLARAHRLLWPRLPRAVTGYSYAMFLLKFLVATLKLDEAPIGRVDLVRPTPSEAIAHP